MMDSPNLWRRRRRNGAALLLVVLLALRLLGPVGSLSAPDGYVAICAGTRIVYIPLSAFGPAPPPGENPAPDPDPCPWFVQFHPLPAATFAAAERIAPVRTVRDLPETASLPPGHVPASFRARASPLRST